MHGREHHALRDLLDESDLALVDALQVNPRASWTTIGQALEISPMTASRRWQKLTASGSAWATVALGDRGMRGAVLEMSVRPGAAMKVATELADIPCVITVGVTSGRFQVFALILGPSLREVSSFLAEGFVPPDEVTDLHSYLFDGFYGGVVWRLGIMNQTKTALIDNSAAHVSQLAEGRPLGPTDRRLFLALGEDGRRTFNDLAAELGSTAYSVRRRLDRLSRRGDIVFRCDLARPLAGWNSMALVWLRAPDGEVETIGRTLGALPETRHCSAVVGPSNIVLIVSLRSLQHMADLRERIGQMFPGLEIVDRRIILRQVKIHGRLLDESGRSVKVVPVDPWSLEFGPDIKEREGLSLVDRDGSSKVHL